ncbi:hypothetical protein OIU78_025609 [Salix suchowensis]|nr:hypothetical protein OIU78_025609 [Salix suchowensis]
MYGFSRREEPWWSPGPPRIPRVNRKLDLHWISPESPHLSSRGEVWFQTPVRTGEVRHANVPWMIHISRVAPMSTLNYPCG